MTERGLIGLGLGLPHSGPLFTSSGHSRRSHERSYSLHDPFHPDAGNDTRRSMDYSLPTSPAPLARPSYSVESDDAMDAAVASVVGLMPLPSKEMESGSQLRGMRTCSEETTLTQPDKESSDSSISHLKLARCRARSAPASNLSAPPEGAALPVVMHRADSLLRLDSETTSTDLKKLLSTRVRHAPPSIDTEKANAPGISSAGTSPSRDASRASRLEPEKSRARVEIYIALNNHITVEGGNITGVLTLRTRKPRRGEARHVRIDGGRIRVLGFEGISEAERYAFYQRSVPLAEATTDHSQIYQSEPDDDGFSVAREGTFSASFTMQVPTASNSKSGTNAPKGVLQDNCVNAAIKYIMLVSFRVRDDSGNASGLDKHADLLNPKISIAHFYRNIELWPSYGPMASHYAEQVHPTLGEAGTVSSRTAQGLLFGGPGMIHLTAVLHRKVWVAGQKCTVYVGVWNETKKFVKSVTLSIIRKASIARPNQSETVSKKQIVEVTMDAVRGPTFGSVTGKGWWAGIEPGTTCEFSHVIDIPADALTVLRTHVIDVSYVLRVSLVTGSLSSNVSVDLPFNIINAISTDGLPIPPPPGLLVGGLKLPKDVPVSFSFQDHLGRDQNSIDLPSWTYPHSTQSQNVTLPLEVIVDWTKKTSASTSDEEEPSRTAQDFTNARLSMTARPRTSRLSDTSHRLSNPPSVTTESMTRLFSELESDLGTSVAGECRSVRFAHDGRQRSSTCSGILKHSSLVKQRVAFLTPEHDNSPTMSMVPSVSHEDPGLHTLGSELGSNCSKQSTLRRFVPGVHDPIRTQSGDIIPRVRQHEDAWTSDDADEILKSISMDGESFNSYDASRLSQGQELVVKERIVGPTTGTLLFPEPWPESATSSSTHPSSGSYQSSFEIPREHAGGLTNDPRSPDAISEVDSQTYFASRPSSLLKDDTPRARSVPRFHPEIVTAPIQPSHSRATMVPSVSSPMLAKSQSAHVVGSPVNLYRRFSPSQHMQVNALEDKLQRLSSQLSPEETRTMGAGRTPWKPTWEHSLLATASSLHDVSPSGPKPNTVRNAHLRSQSGPNSRESNYSSGGSGSEHVSRSTVRSRIAALEERSRSRPVSEYSSVSPTSSNFVNK